MPRVFFFLSLCLVSMFLDDVVFSEEPPKTFVSLLFGTLLGYQCLDGLPSALVMLLPAALPWRRQTVILLFCYAVFCPPLLLAFPRGIVLSEVRFAKRGDLKKRGPHYFSSKECEIW